MFSLICFFSLAYSPQRFENEWKTGANMPYFSKFRGKVKLEIKTGAAMQIVVLFHVKINPDYQ
jgi:hypothetical protein